MPIPDSIRQIHLSDTDGNELGVVPIPPGSLSDLQWVDESLAVSPGGKRQVTWGWLKDIIPQQ